MRKQYDGVFVGCFGTKSADLFQNSFYHLYQIIKENSSSLVVLGLTNEQFSKELGFNTIPEACKLLEGCRHVLAIGLFMADGSQYQQFKQYCQMKDFDVLPPILQSYTKEIAEMINKKWGKQDNQKVILLAHGSEQFNNYEYVQLQELLNSNFTICLAEANQSIEDCVMQAQEQHLVLANLMFSNGHHFVNEKKKFIEACNKFNKEYTIEEKAIGQLEEFRKLFVSIESNGR